ncbi:pentapeptide repeat-containing protein [Rhabdothermincola salaria]|uniref:pentapeptide repeat-containing protein n=1 Tax=Rhabdothermincola salaria TaxID=2903142 RepID=UPI001E2BCC43|nr:pentapeptide repeat-containing protein [Rhabdothermincola salaria]
MAWITVKEPFATPPRLTAIGPGDPAFPEIEGTRNQRWAEVDRDGTEPLPDDLATLRLESCALVGVAFSHLAGAEIEGHWSSWAACDLSGARVESLRECTIADTKLTGTDLSEADLSDVVFERCVLQLTSLRMARLRRVQFSDCTLVEVDAYQCHMEDVSFDGSEITDLNVDRVTAERVDLRGVRSLGLQAVGRLDGCLVDEAQLAALAHDLAFAVGLDLERPHDAER